MQDATEDDDNSGLDDEERYGVGLGVRDRVGALQNARLGSHFGPGLQGLRRRDNNILIRAAGDGEGGEEEDGGRRGGGEPHGSLDEAGHVAANGSGGVVPRLVAALHWEAS